MSKQSTAIQQTVRILKTTEGTVFQVDTARLPRPARTLACNVVDAYRRGSSIEMVFGQQRPSSDMLLAALIVSVPAKAIPLVLNRSETPSFREKVDAFIQREVGALPEVSVPADAYPERTVFERASTMTMTQADHESDIRFYRVLPTEMRRMHLDGDLSPDFLWPVVEIALSTEQLACLIKKLDELVPAEPRG